MASATTQDPQDTAGPDPRPQRREEPQREALTGMEAVQELGKGGKLSQDEKLGALDWFLSDDAGLETEVIELNVGNRKQAKWIEWEIRPVDLETLRRIRKASTGKAKRGETAEIDEIEANLRIVVEGTVTPDLKAAAKKLALIDPADALKSRFRGKPGLLGQIAGEIMSVSGYDDDDVREVDAGKP